MFVFTMVPTRKESLLFIIIRLEKKNYYFKEINVDFLILEFMLSVYA